MLGTWHLHWAESQFAIGHGEEVSKPFSRPCNEPDLNVLTNLMCLQAQKQREAELAAASNIEETEDAEDPAATTAPGEAAADQQQVGDGTALPAGLTVRRKAAAGSGNGAAAPPGGTAAAAQAAQQQAANAAGSGGGAAAAAAPPAATSVAAAALQKPAAPATDSGQAAGQPPPAPAAGLEVRPKRHKVAAADSAAASRASAAAGDSRRQAPKSAEDGPRLLSRAELAARQKQQHEAAGVDADLDALARARRGSAAEAEVTCFVVMFCDSLRPHHCTDAQLVLSDRGEVRCAAS